MSSTETEYLSREITRHRKLEACKECNEIDEQRVIKRKERDSANLRRLLSLGPVHSSSVVFSVQAFSVCESGRAVALGVCVSCQ